MIAEQNVDLAFVAVFFVYGLALFALGEAVTLAARRSRATRFAASLRYLAAFGFLGALTAWLDAGLIVMNAPASSNAEPLRTVRVLLLAGAGASLLLFGTRLLAFTRREHRWMIPVPWVLFGAWLVSLVVPHLGPVETVQPVAATLCFECHQAQSGAFVVASGDWLTAADIWAHYLLYFPGALLTAGAFLAQRRRFLARGHPAIARHSVGAAAAFGLTAITSGLIVAPAPYFPATLLNYASFHSALQIPSQLLTAAAAVFGAYSAVRILSVFEIEHSRQLARANAERFAAQHQALEAQAHAQQEMAEWNRQLESRVAERTRELEALHAQLKDVAVLEERDRIARELHDSLAQALGYLGLRASILAEHLEGGDTSQAMEETRRIEEIVDDAYADVREAILGLRTKTSRQGLVATLQEYLRKYGLQTGIRAELDAPNGADLVFSPSVEIQLLRVVQEALANVRKHARAERVIVRFWREDEVTCIAVEDDGCGFDPAEQPHGEQFGLATMRERVQGVAGSLRISSGSGLGTSVVVCLPEATRLAGERSPLAPAGSASTGEG